MLKLILGKAGTGKTSYILNRSVEYALNEKNSIILVPEQFSFALERKLLDMTNGVRTDKITVLSFGRLCENIFSLYGGRVGKSLNDTAKLILMKLSISEIRDRLTVYENIRDQNSFTETMISAIDELKACGVYPDDIDRALDNIEDKQLSDKLIDIGEVYRVYQAMLEQSFKDPLDDIYKAIAIPEINDFFSDKTVLIDSFDYFSPPQKRMIELMIEHCENVELSLCADDRPIMPSDVFLLMKQTAEWFKATAKRLSEDIPEVIYLENNYRARTEGIRYIGDIALNKHIRENITDNSVTVAECGNLYDELTYIAAEIKRLVHEENYRYRDIALVTRSIDDSSSALETIFNIYDIPLFFSKKEAVTAKPIFNCVKTLLEIGKSSLSTEIILRLARNPALKLSQSDYSLLEDYVYIWNIKGKAWRDEFKNSPDGINAKNTASERKRLEQIESTRKAIMEPLIKLIESMRVGTAEAITKGIFTYIDDIELIQNLKKFYKKQLELDGDEKYYNDAIKEMSDMYNILIDMMDLFCDIMGEKYMDKKDICELLIGAIDSIEVGNIPNTLDCVVAGSADIVRFDSPKVTFVYDVNSGVFPQKLSFKGVFTRAEQEKLITNGIEINLNPLQKAIVEKMYLYTALTSPCEKLYVSYTVNTLKGDITEPSLIIEQILSGLNISKLVVSQLDSSAYVYDLFTLRNSYVKLKSQGLNCDTELELLMELKDSSFLRTTEDLFNEKLAENIFPETAKKLIGDEVRLSPTKIELFYSCPFRYFIENMLKIKKREKAEYNQLVSGSAMHKVLEDIINQIGVTVGFDKIVGLTHAQVEKMVTNILQSYINSILSVNSQTGARFKYNLERLVNMLCIIVEHIGREFAASEFKPIGTEVSVRADGMVSPIKLEIDGTKFYINGSIDRVDLANINNEDYVLVTDYKSGDKKFSLNEFFYGLNMQMLIYLFALCDDDEVDNTDRLVSKYGRLKPTGIAYAPININPIDYINSPMDSIKNSELDSNLMTNGLFVYKDEVLEALEKDKLGRFYPINFTSRTNKPKHKDTILSEKSFSYIREAVYEKIERMGESILRGEICPLPIKKDDKFACEYCPNALLCKNKYQKVFKDIKVINKLYDELMEIEENEENKEE